MTNVQDTLDGQPATAEAVHGLWRALLDDGARINAEAWRRAVVSLHSVGRCRCGGYLRPGSAVHVGAHRWDYEALCEVCGETWVAPGGRVLRGSSRRSERKG